MEFLLLFNERAGAPRPEAKVLAAGMAAMEKYSAELRKRGVFRRGGPLAPASDGAGVRVRGGKPVVSDGPFAETKELVAGFWIVDVASREEALEIARACPHAKHGPIELHAVGDRRSVSDSENGTPFLLAFRREPGLRDPDGAKRREMIEFGQTLERDGIQFEIAPLADHPKPARVEAREARMLVTDGPFAETKDVIGGYSLVRAKGRAHAIELATRYPHARWGPVEVREILFFDPV
ncbi:MAG: YciI family protein [Myxococcota bacterium]